MLMPLTISQSITTQNDLFAALIFILFVYKLLDVICYDKIVLDGEQILDIVMLGLLVAYAYLAKTSVCASMIMFMPWLLVVRLGKKDDFKKMKLIYSKEIIFHRLFDELQLLAIF